jgi:hypothetical protein
MVGRGLEYGELIGSVQIHRYFKTLRFLLGKIVCFQKLSFSSKTPIFLPSKNSYFKKWPVSPPNNRGS